MVPNGVEAYKIVQERNIVLTVVSRVLAGSLTISRYRMVSNLWLFATWLAGFATTSFAVPHPGLRCLAYTTANLTARSNLPSSTIYGVNLGSWHVSARCTRSQMCNQYPRFVFEPYMAMSEWASMGGTGLCSEFDLVSNLGQSAANFAFAKHWYVSCSLY